MITHIYFSTRLRIPLTISPTSSYDLVANTHWILPLCCVCHCFVSFSFKDPKISFHGLYSRKYVGSTFSPCCKSNEKSFAKAEHAWNEHHPNVWKDTKIIDKFNKIRELKVKKVALHIQLTPEERPFDWDVGLELPNCWIFFHWRTQPKIIVTTAVQNGKGFSSIFTKI